MNEALAQAFPEQLEKITEGQYQMLYDFGELSAADYNAVIDAMRKYIASLVDATDWQKKGVWVWREMAEPFIRKDVRYDFAFHGETLPSTSNRLRAVALALLRVRRLFQRR
ncbi:hypothetical protein VARIO8X_60351 [Burkholderiales bacterium 8X]|nr:hypothetical protein VARIO8X_60351 [Burkholderiales bacterium 8X]